MQRRAAAEPNEAHVPTPSPHKASDRGVLSASPPALIDGETPSPVCPHLLQSMQLHLP
jgi:hypothetical protein